jgi:hypothetical protein
MTHDLLKNILDEMAVQVTSITITDPSGVFHAASACSARSSFDPRLSDAIARGPSGVQDLRERGCPRGGLHPDPADGEEEEKQLQEFREFLENVTPEDFE